MASKDISTCTMRTHFSKHSLGMRWSYGSASSSTKSVKLQEFSIFSNKFPKEWFIMSTPKVPGPQSSMSSPRPKKVLDITLHYLNVSKKSLRVVFKFSVHDQIGKIVSGSGSHLFHAESTQGMICEVDVHRGSPLDVLYFQCEFTVYGYDVYTSTSYQEVNLHDDELRMNLKNLMESGKSSDLAVTFDSGCPFLAHRIVLEYRVPEFLRLHAQELEGCTVHMTGTRYQAFKSFLEYVYTSKVNDFDFERYTQELFVLAKKYNVVGLILLCRSSGNLKP